MELALARLVGAGVTLVFEGYGQAIPSGSIEKGLELIRFIAARRPDLVLELTGGVVREIWKEWRDARLPDDLAATHVEALPAIMDSCRVAPGTVADGLNALAGNPDALTGSHNLSPYTAIASAILEQADNEGLLDADRLNINIAFFFLDRLLARLMRDGALFEELGPLMTQYIAQRAWQTAIQPAEPAAPENSPGSSEAEFFFNAPAATAPQPHTEPETAPQQAVGTTGSEPLKTAAQQYGVPLELLNLLAERAATRFGALDATATDDLAFGIRTLIQRLTQSDADPVAPAAAMMRQEAGRLLEAADLAAAAQMLAQAEDINLKAAPSDLANAHKHLTAAAATRACRALIEELSGDFRRAARHYAQCARCLPEGDRAGRRSYLLQQASALAAQGELLGETSALAEAAQSYAQAGRLLSEQEDPFEWARAHLELGRILLELGSREGRTERYLAAAVHFKPASDVFSHLRQPESWARAQLGLADALRAQGEVQGDVVTLGEAAFSYRATLGVASRDRMPAEWAAANYRLALTLLRIDAESGATGNHEEAVMALRAMHSADVISPVLRCVAKVKLGRTLMVLARTTGEGWHEEEALALLETARNESAGLAAGDARAEIEDEVGGLLAAIGEARTSVELVSSGCALKEAALAHARVAGDMEKARRIASEVEAIRAAVSAMSSGIDQAA